MPLMFDFPLEKLKTYQGINPSPADMDAFWDNSLAEMRALDPQVTLVPADFQAPFADCFHMYFTGVGGARVHAKLLRPKKPAGQHPAVVMFHGYSGDSGDWLGKLGYVAAGYTVAALDCRGQGGCLKITGRSPVGRCADISSADWMMPLPARQKSCCSAIFSWIQPNSPRW